MDLHGDDALFVRAPAALAYRRLTDVARWPGWWTRARVRPLPPQDGDEVWSVELAGAPLRRVRVAARLQGWRHDQGFLLHLRGDLDGRAEFWLDPREDGVTVHHLLTGQGRWRRPPVAFEDYRRAVRRGLWGLKDALQLEVRTSAGLVP